MEIIEQIGAYAGLAAVVGLAVLAALYFSQARDVKRLREWAGRAPERGAMPGGSPAPHQRVMAQPQRTVPHKVPSPAAAVAQGTARPGAGAVRPGAPTQPPAAPVRAAAPGAAPPAVTGPATATPAAARVAAGEEGPRTPAAEEKGGVSQDTMMHPPPSPPAERELDEEREADELEGDEEEAPLREDEVAQDAAPEDEQLRDDDDDYDDDYDAGLGEDTEDSPALAQPPPVPRPSIPIPPPPPTRAVSRPSQGPILPPYEKSRPGAGQPPWYRRGLASRGGVLVIGATVFVIALVAVGLSQFGGGDDPEQPAQEQAGSANVGSGGGDAGTRAGRSGIVPARVTVSVLNGTTVGGLAAELGDKLQGQGFRLGNVTNSTDQQRAESVVLFAPGAEREAAEVGRRLKIAQREPIDPESQTLAGDATVVVITGADLTD